MIIIILIIIIIIIIVIIIIKAKRPIINLEFKSNNKLVIHNLVNLRAHSFILSSFRVKHVTSS